MTRCTLLPDELKSSPMFASCSTSPGEAGTTREMIGVINQH